MTSGLLMVCLDKILDSGLLGHLVSVRVVTANNPSNPFKQSDSNGIMS